MASSSWLSVTRFCSDDVSWACLFVVSFVINCFGMKFNCLNDVRVFLTDDASRENISGNLISERSTECRFVLIVTRPEAVSWCFTF